MRMVLAALIGLLITPVAGAQENAWANKLFGSELSHDFGVVARGAQLKHSFKFTNIYKVPLEITDIRVSCGCVKGEPSVKTIQPGESAQLLVTMDGKKFNGSKTVSVFVSVGPKYISTATLTVSANARGDVAFSPNDIDFGNMQRGQTPSKSIDVEYNGAANWAVTEIVKTSSAPFELRVEGLPRLVGSGPRRGYRITATMKADAPTGSFKQEVVLKTNDPSAPVLTFQIVGSVQAGLAVSPSPIIVRDLKVGESQTKKVFVRASKNFRIKSIDGQGDGITVDVPNREDTTLVLTVNINPTKAGPLRRQLMIHTDLDNETTPLVIEATIEP